VAKWRWLKRLGRFWNETVGKVVPRLQVRRWADRSMDAAPVAEWAEGVASGRLTVADWEARMRAEIKKEALRQYIAGRGGLDKMTAKDFGSIGGVIGEQYKYLNKFAREIADGKLSEGQIRRRMEMYVNSTREAYERAAARAAKEAGEDEVRWVLDPGAEHCTGDPGCTELAALGWRKVADDPFKGHVPGDGKTPCKTSCRCHREWRRSKK